MLKARGPPGLAASALPVSTRRIGAKDVGKGQMGSALMGSLQMSCFFDRGTFWVPPLTYFHLPKSARAYLFPQSVKTHYFCSGPISVDPICPQPKIAHQNSQHRRSVGKMSLIIH